MIRILEGDCRLVLPTLEAGSVQTCCTSPPYWALRDYGTAQWEGGDARCDHANGRQGATRRDVSPERLAERAKLYGTGTGTGSDVPPQQYADICGKCGGRRIDSQLGLEETPSEYISNMVAVFREVWRVLRDDGTLWVNMGDCYAHGECGGKSPMDKRTYGIGGGNVRGRSTNGTLSVGLKPKDLCMMPARLAMALQADGWYLRSDIIWHKPNPMPESVTDRPTKAHEYIFLLTKAERYFYDAEAIREPHEESRGRGFGDLDSTNPQHENQGWNGRGFSINRRHYNPAGRNKRTVWTVATQPYSEAHFATFPEEIPKLCILAGSKPGDTVLDPFFGSGTVGKVAIELGRKVIGIELNPAYVKMAKDRCNTTPGLPLSSNSPSSYGTLGIDQSDSKENWLLPEFENLGKV